MDKFKNLAFAIKQARLTIGLSQEEFAEKLQVSSTHVKHIESGHRKPSIEILFNICGITGLSLDNILFDSKPLKTDTDIKIETLIDMCSEEQKTLIVKIIEVIISHNKKSQ